MATAQETTAGTSGTDLTASVPTPSAPDREPFRGGEPGSRWKFTVDQYDRMAGAGVFGEDDRVELIEGDVVVMSPIGPPHASVSVRLNHLLTATFGTRGMISPGNPVRIGDDSEPQPDFLVLRPRDDFYASAHPTPADVFLAIEIMDSSAAYDRGTKLSLYARSHISEVWLVDLNRDRVEVYRKPDDGVYGEKQTLSRGQAVAPLAFPADALAVDAILGPATPTGTEGHR